ncbi:Membrane protein involved in the export of O-antigen and teichoic acid [Paenibacillus macquariensis]|uniref:Membrane protein involved in the export of O-antigen and teichoic acid n=2 Tax=Paenibacillus macquariensis TaxID=948756 RepID=A0ABY1KCJ7_9BACL|nr:Membrane protein involved in the export of O-antigen and teichoic acid [Paenibacillus macquariensis]
MMKDNVSVASRMLHGAFILTLATVLSKLIGTLQKIPLQNMGGDVVFGIYNTVYPFYSLVITLAIAGFPIAISKFVAENDVTGNDKENRRILRLSSWFIGLLGVLLGLCTYVGAPLIARWIDNAHVVSAIRYVSIAFLFVPLMSLLRGFFQGHQNMIPTAISQIVEQSVRVTVMIVLLLYLTSRQAGPEDIAAGALFGSAAGGAAGLLVMLFYWRRYRTKVNKKMIPVEVTIRRETATVIHVDVAAAVNGDPIGSESSWRLLRNIVVYAIPICLASLALPLMNLVDTFTVPKLLKAGGIGDSGAMIQFGIYNRGIPLVQLITMLATSLSVLFIPALAEARFKRDNLLMQNQCRLALRWFWMMGLAASVGLCVLAEPINVMLYQDTTGTDTIRWIAFTAAFSSISLISAALLQGIGMVKAPAMNLLIGALAKTLLNLWLVPKLGITGAAIAFVAAQLLAAALNVALLVRSTGLRLGAGAMLLKPAIILAGLASAAVGAQWAAAAVLSALGIRAGRMVALVESLSGVTAGAIVFVILVALTKLIREEELRMLPKVGNGLARLLQKLRVLR